MSDASNQWWRGAVLYQVYPRSYQDSNGDGVGDLQGLIRRLDHIADLGVAGIWLSPVVASPRPDFGYDVSDYRAIDPLFGTLEDFDALVSAVHARGLKLIIDQVYAHTSDAHDWFRASRQDRTNDRADWYVWADARPDGSPPNNWQSVFGGAAWTWDARRGQYYMHNFLASQPQLNVRNPDVQEALVDVTRFWLDRGVDGFRLDAINFAIHDAALTDNPPDPRPGPRTRPFDFQLHLHNQSQPEIPAFLERLRALAETYGERFFVAEVVGAEAEAEMHAFTQGGDRLHSAYGFNYLYARTLTAELVAEAAQRWPGHEGEGWPGWTFSNHDTPRVASRWAAGRDTDTVARLAMLLLMCLRGTVFVYQGEELGLPQADVPFERLVDPEAIANWPQTLGRDGARTPMPWTSDTPYGGFSEAEPWLPMDDRHLTRSVASQQSDPRSMLALTRALIALRRATPALRLGRMTVLEATAARLIFRREDSAQTLICAFNLGDAALDWAAPDAAELITGVNGGEARAGQLPPMAGQIVTLSS